AMLVEQRDERARRMARLADDAEATRSAATLAAERLQQADQERAAAAQHLLMDEDELSRTVAELDALRLALSERQAALETAKGALIDHVTREVEARNRAAALERRAEEVARQLDKLRNEEATLEQRRADLDRLRGELTAATGAQEARTNELRALSEARRRAERHALELEGTFLQSRSRQESLTQIQSNYEGFQRGVRSIMRAEQHPDGVLGVVADVIDIPQEYERAVAAVLGDRLQYVIVRAEEDGAEAVDRLRQDSSGR